MSNAAPAAARESGHASGELAYRADIDGLRAIAVLLVVITHAGVTAVPGGFIGVDVFFVISGFLITGLITVQASQDAFSFRSFYARRAKRLLPALYATILAVLAAGWWLLIPSDYSLLSQSALWAAGFFSNVFFWRNSGGYFSPDASAFPLLHLWSLSLEEQFYFVWPALLLLLLRLRAPGLRVGVLAIAIAAPFLWAEYRVRDGSIGPYFLLESRVGEFLIGALLSLTWAARRGGALAANVCSASGLLLIAGCALLLNDHARFPGVAALAPCLGAALILAAPQFGDSLVSRALSSRPAVFVGLISYSVYLWHWPLVSYLRVSRVAFTPLIPLGVIAASLLLGWISWYGLERRFRALLDRGNNAALAMSALAAVAVVAGALAIGWSAGFPQRFPYALLTQDQLLAERGRYWRDLPARNATLVPGATTRQLLIVGNSHAYDLAYALNENGYPGKIQLIETDHQCFNFGHDPVSPADTALCAERLNAVMTSPALKAADAVYLHDNWGGWNPAGLADMLMRLRAQTAAPIYVFGPKMSFTDDALAISKQAQQHRVASVAGINVYARTFEAGEKAERDRLAKAFFQARQFPGVRYISTMEVQCGAPRRCDLLSGDGKYLYFDASHFTLEGSRRFGQRLRQAHPEVF